MRLSLRFLIPLLLALGAFAYGAVPLADSLMQRWFVRDLDIRSSLIASAVQEPLANLIVSGSTPRIAAYFNRMTQDERLYAVGLCQDARGAPIATVNFPRDIDCATLQSYKGEDGHVLHSPQWTHCILRFTPWTADAASLAQLALVHDMSFVTRRSEETRRLLFYFFIALWSLHRPYHGDHRSTLLARLGAGAACSAARRRDSAAFGRPDGARAAAHRAGLGRSHPRS